MDVEGLGWDNLSPIQNFFNVAIASVVFAQDFSFGQSVTCRLLNAD